MSWISYLLLYFHRKSSVVRLLLGVQLASLVIVADGFLLLFLAKRYGNYVALSAMLSTGVIGLALLCNSINTVINRLHATLRDGRNPKKEYGRILSLVIAGILILIPGLFSDAVGVIIYLPPVRALIGHAFVRRIDHNLGESYEYLKVVQAGR